MAEFPEFDFDEDLSFLEDDYVDQKDMNLRSAALANPSEDYFLQARPEQPKRTIGMYVAEHGFSVPLLDGADDVNSAVDNGSFMIRSELMQDYAGLSGIFSSFVTAWAFQPDANGFQARYNELIKDGLKSGAISPDMYMERFVPYGGWEAEHRSLAEQAMSLGLRQVPIDLRVSASAWRYIPGTNVTMFRDPHVEDRYHFGVKPPDQGVGDYIFDKGTHADPQTFRKHHQPFVAEPFIDMYEQIRALPLFDVTQVPVMEFQKDENGGIHFLQYRRVDKTLQPVEPFDLPHGYSFRTDSVRGVTSPDGESHRLLINPTNIRNIKGRSVFADQFYFADYLKLKTQLVCKLAKFVVCQDWLSFKDNHTPSAPLILPELAVGLYGADEASWPIVQKMHDLPARYSSIPRSDVPLAYFDMRVISNGREAVIESDWTPKEP